MNIEGWQNVMLIWSFKHDLIQTLPLGNSMWAFLKMSFMYLSHMTNRMWAMLRILWKADQVSSYLFPLPTGSEWHCTFCQRQFHHIFSYDQLSKSVTLHIFVKGSLITSFPTTNRMQVTLYTLWKTVLLNILYDPQWVSDIAHFVKGSLIIILWQIVREWHDTF